jgi:hypothetical protein
LDLAGPGLTRGASFFEKLRPQLSDLSSLWSSEGESLLDDADEIVDGSLEF